MKRSAQVENHSRGAQHACRQEGKSIDHGLNLVAVPMGMETLDGYPVYCREKLEFDSETEGFKIAMAGGIRGESGKNTQTFRRDGKECDDSETTLPWRPHAR